MSNEFLRKRNVQDIWSNVHLPVQESQYLTCGVNEIDSSMGGGFLLGKIAELYGPSGSGKTQFALSLTSEVLMKNFVNSTDHVVLYIFTTGNFPIQRIYEILNSKYNDCKHLVKDKDFEVGNLLKYLYIQKVTDNDELQFTFTDKLEEMLQLNVKLIVIDSIASIYRLIQNEGFLNLKFNSIVKIATIMKRVAHEYNLLVLAINQATSVFNKKNVPFLNPKSAIKPALGETWERCINLRILISRKRDERFNKEIRHFQIIFSSSSPTSFPLPFITTKRGIEYNFSL